MILSKWTDSREAMRVAQLVGYEQGQALMKYLRRSREETLKNLLAARGAEVWRLQGMVQILDDLVERLEGADETAREMEQKEKARR